jgi:two-component system sensor histidine kinase HydH
MNLLKQTSVILGLISLVIGGWALYRHWRSKITLLFSLFCFVISIWAFSFVAYEMLLGRLSYDIHLFCNIWLTPIAITLLHQILFKRPDRMSQFVQWLSIAGAVILGGMIAFSFDRTGWPTQVMLFYPSLILLEYLYGMAQDVMFRVPMNTEYISPTKKLIIYVGLAISLAFCTFDHIPALGYTIPAIGNLLLTLYLAFASQVITPQKLLRLEALISRFLAVVILALIITGFFALLYPYISETFPLFLLNSFLISFAVLSLWNPLVTLFRYLGGQVFQSRSNKLETQVNEFKRVLSSLSDQNAIRELTVQTIERWNYGGIVTLIEGTQALMIPDHVKAYFDNAKARKIAPVLHREILMIEREQTMLEAGRKTLDWLLQFLDTQRADILIPSFHQERLVLLTRIRMETSFEDATVNLSLYGTLYDVLQDVGVTLVRLTRVAEEKEKDRLMLLGEMAAGLAHEVRNPLGAIRGAAELIPDPTSPWALMIQEEVSRLNRLVSQFLDFAQDPKEQSEWIDLVEVAEVTMQALKPTLPAKMKISLQSDGASRVVAVPDHVRQVLINVIQNSVKATEDSPLPEIQITVTDHEIFVRDNGIGMTNEVKQKVFQPFFTSFKQGSGLGLSICQRLMSFNGGSIKILSTPQGGAEVILSFPERGFP